MASTKWKYVKKDGKPKCDGRYLVTCIVDSVKIVTILKFSKNPKELHPHCFWSENISSDGAFYDIHTEWGTCDECDKYVIAWMELPAFA